jgi:hypothetical protein
MAKRAPLQQVTSTPDAATLRRVAAEAERIEPPAVVRTSRKAVLINIKVAEETAIALARKAVAEGQTQKQIIVRALQSLGLPVDPLDLEDRSPRRRAAA